MPSVSAPQHRFFEMVAHDPAAARRVGVPQSVGREFVEADQAAGKHFAGPKHKRREMLARALLRHGQ